MAVEIGDEASEKTWEIIKAIVKEVAGTAANELLKLFSNMDSAKGNQKSWKTLFSDTAAKAKESLNTGVDYMLVANEGQEEFSEKEFAASQLKLEADLEPITKSARAVQIPKDAKMTASFNVSSKNEIRRLLLGCGIPHSIEHNLNGHYDTVHYFPQHAAEIAALVALNQNTFSNAFGEVPDTDAKNVYSLADTQAPSKTLSFDVPSISIEGKTISSAELAKVVVENANAQGIALDFEARDGKAKISASSEAIDKLTEKKPQVVSTSVQDVKQIAENKFATRTTTTTQTSEPVPKTVGRNTKENVSEVMEPKIEQAHKLNEDKTFKRTQSISL